MMISKVTRLSTIKQRRLTRTNFSACRRWLNVVSHQIYWCLCESSTIWRKDTNNLNNDFGVGIMVLSTHGTTNHEHQHIYVKGIIICVLVQLDHIKSDTTSLALRISGVLDIDS